ncbi:putative prophage protein [Xenorhabdus nematophila ATCC 19061]|uniref:Prophage protein n=1 Tax=Xenorhabdus nematophila (strain ATCC 19061 / DSM 3370 / CCUG 14189 / LMG 1036 / NCIMB 9965 / AN6) TaxID=406817 RepID=D3V988_XENNA|nr:phage tail assembly protein [Xenorhabdus nematophila]CBJ91438.1 putative prophage protein [Xenorhabdus nematophila ATCC 19061]CEK24259.1 putative prophage protein [Xenorhabdus nematophila AN6/1]
MHFELRHGLAYGKDGDTELQFTVELRQLTAGDLIEAETASERVVVTANGPALLSSPALMGYELLRRTIARVGKIQGPLPLVMLKTLHQDDLELIARHADVQRAAALDTVARVADEGR